MPVDPMACSEERHRLAAALDRSPVHQLLALAGEDTWRGPLAVAFRAEVRRAVAITAQASAQLRSTPIGG